ncbi:MAG: c-type cytochrome [bacterium]
MKRGALRLLHAGLFAGMLAGGIGMPMTGQGAAAPGQAGLDPMARRMQACTPCHGQEGRATAEGYFPRIAGKPAGYLYNQLLHFRDGRRTNAAMAYLVQHLSDDYLREIADWFARQQLPYPPPSAVRADAAQLARGERLVRDGDPARRIPACAACHGAALTGVQPAMPGLLGLPRDYIAGQIGAWKSRQRRAAAPDCMAEVSARLSSEDIAAVAAWLSTQPVPAGGQAAAGLAGTMPLKCGSMP